MKNKSFRLMIALLAFLLGISVVYCLSFKINSKNLFSKSDRKTVDKIKIWESILSFENQDLSKFDNDQSIKLFNDFYELIDKQIYAGYGDARLFTKISNEEKSMRYILVGAKSAPISNARTELFFQIFDRNGNHLTSTKDFTKSRFHLKDIKIRYSPEIDREIIEVTSDAELSENLEMKRLYALVGDEIVLIQRENPNKNQ